MHCRQRASGEGLVLCECDQHGAVAALRAERGHGGDAGGGRRGAGARAPGRLPGLEAHPRRAPGAPPQHPHLRAQCG